MRLSLRGTREKEVEKGQRDLTSKVGLRKDGNVEDGDPAAALSSIRKAVSEAITKGMINWKSEIKKELSDFRVSLRQDLKEQLDEMMTEINQKFQDVTVQMEETARQVEDLERSITESERWDIGVKDILLQLLRNQKTLQSKLSDLEGRSRRNNIRIYLVSENAEGSSMPRFIENLIKTELGDLLELNQGDDLGIERAHRALTSRPPAGMPPRSIVVRFLQFTTKEKILHAAWKKKILVEEKRVYTLIMTTLKRCNKRESTVIYNNAFEAAEDLTKRGIAVGPIQPSKTTGVTEEDITGLLPWSVSHKLRGGKSPDFRQGVREKLRGFQRKDRELISVYLLRLNRKSRLVIGIVQ
ncbi:hypothetical protein M9458_056531 [Cirrhinus mrigala]|uniref:L1 transposable element RRM domain-containing protein n=1 Tax=Cirrhinus mrigala TaxID=683832 RepID=A0ABD0MEE3_CIRMR